MSHVPLYSSKLNVLFCSNRRSISREDEQAVWRSIALSLVPSSFVVFAVVLLLCILQSSVHIIDWYWPARGANNWTKRCTIIMKSNLKGNNSIIVPRYRGINKMIFWYGSRLRNVTNLLLLLALPLLSLPGRMRWWGSLSPVSSNGAHLARPITGHLPLIIILWQCSSVQRQPDEHGTPAMLMMMTTTTQFLGWLINWWTVGMACLQ